MYLVKDQEHISVHVSDTDPQWLNFQGFILTKFDRKILSANELQHINYAQILLHHQFPIIEGLQNTLLQKCKGKTMVAEYRSYMIEEITGLLPLLSAVTSPF